MVQMMPAACLPWAVLIQAHFTIYLYPNSFQNIYLAFGGIFNVSKAANKYPKSYTLKKSCFVASLSIALKPNEGKFPHTQIYKLFGGWRMMKDIYEI
jgi:hypothetical protein